MNKFEPGDLVVLDQPHRSNIWHGVVAFVTRIVPSVIHRDIRFYEIAVYEPEAEPNDEPYKIGVYQESELVGLRDYASERLFQEFLDLIGASRDEGEDTTHTSRYVVTPHVT